MAANSHKVKKDLFSPAASAGGKSNHAKEVAAQSHPQPDATLDTVLEAIKNVTTTVQVMDSRSLEVQRDVKEIRSSLQGLGERVQDAETRIAQLEQQVSGLQDIQEQVQQLKKECTQLEDRNRRSNLRFFGIPEEVENNNPIAFLEHWIPRLLQTSFDPKLDIQRAHRIRPRNPQQQKGPRPMIAFFLRYRQAEEILKLAKQSKNLQYKGHPIRVSADFSQETNSVRKQFLALRPALKKLNARYGLVDPAKMLVTIGSNSWEFFTPNDLSSFISSRQVQSMDTTPSTQRSKLASSKQSSPVKLSHAGSLSSADLPLEKPKPHRSRRRRSLSPTMGAPKKRLSTIFSEMDADLQELWSSHSPKHPLPGRQFSKGRRRHSLSPDPHARSNSRSPLKPRAPTSDVD